MGDNGEEEIKNLKKWVMSFIDGALGPCFFNCIDSGIIVVENSATNK